MKIDREELKVSTGENKIIELESIRGIAAMLVALHHVPGWNPAFYNIGMLRNGYLMVDLFFVLSGFVIYKTYARRINRITDLMRFQFLRFGRLYPVHLTMLLVFLGIEFMKLFAAGHFGVNSANTTPFVENSWIAFVKHIFLVQGIGPTANIATFNGPAWSISVEFYTYLIFALIVLFARRFHLVIAAAVAAVSLLLLISGMGHGCESLLRCTAGFFIGCLTAKAAVCSKARLPSYTPLLAALSIIVFTEFNTESRYDPVIFFLTSLLIFSITTSTDGPTRKMLRTKFMAWLGLISYSLYMTHQAVLWAVNQVFRVIIKRPETLIDGKMVPQLSVMESLCAHIAIIFLILVSAALMHYGIEKPWRSKSRRIAFKKFPPA